jgi:biopolymer transport protein TolR
LIITLNTQNEVFINDFKVSVEGLGEKLQSILKGRAEREVFLKADKTITWGIVAQVMAEIKGAGVEKLGMVTEPEKFDKESKRSTSKSP